MITITDINGRQHHLHRDAVAHITVAGTSSQWHGIRAIVRTFDGHVIEARETAAAIMTAIEKDGAVLTAAPQPEGE